jgi:hypothetical protein
VLDSAEAPAHHECNSSLAETTIATPVYGEDARAPGAEKPILRHGEDPRSRQRDAVDGAERRIITTSDTAITPYAEDCLHGVYCHQRGAGDLVHWKDVR